MVHQRINRHITIFLTTILVCLLSFGLKGCYFDHEEELYPPESCNSNNVSYRLDVLPILEVACYECHDLANAPVLGDGINIEGYTKLKQYIDDNANKFTGSLNWDGQGSPMPKNGSKLDVCSIDRIEVWIEEGMLNN